VSEKKTRKIVRKVPCPDCDQLFGTEQTMSMHRKFKHEGGSPPAPASRQRSAPRSSPKGNASEPEESDGGVFGWLL